MLAHLTKQVYMTSTFIKLKRIYRKKNQTLTNSLKDTFKDSIEIVIADLGLHIVCEAKTSKSKEKLLEDAKKQRISFKNNEVIFPLNYSGINTNKI